jgi:FkbM family methyltransferase
MRTVVGLLHPVRAIALGLDVHPRLLERVVDVRRRSCGRTDVLKIVVTCNQREPVAWIESLPADAVLWDIGANVGLYAIYAAKRGVRVLAFEPAASTLAVLTRNIELNAVSDKVAAYGVALSDKTKLDALYMDSARTEPGHAVHSFGTRRTVAGTIEGGFQQATIGFTADDKVAALLFRPAE